MFVPSFPFLVVMIAVKYTKSVSFLKLEPFILTGSTNDFLLFEPFIISVFVQHGRTKALTSHLFTPLFIFIHLPLIHFAPPPRILIDFKKSKLLTYFCILLCIIMHLLLFLSTGWLTFCHMQGRTLGGLCVCVWGGGGGGVTPPNN